MIGLVIVCFLFSSVLGLEFSYDHQEDWDCLPNSKCCGNRQSPINIVTNDLVNGNQINLKALLFSNFQKFIRGTWKNNGHSVKLTPTQKTLSTTSHLGKYKLLQFHFHWGKSNDEGSEHAVNGDRYSGELHFVHQTTNPNAKNTDGDYYTVVGVFLQADDRISAKGTIWELLSNIPNYEQSRMISSRIPYKALLPKTMQYYHYKGSLTTPLCDEIVQWFVMRDPIKVPTSFFEAVRKAPAAHRGEVIEENFRNTQSLNGRKVFKFISNCYIL